MGTYRVLPDPTAYLRTADNVVIQYDPASMNTAYLAFVAWRAAGNTPDPLPPPSLPEQADTMLAAKLATGVALTSSGTPALNGTYALDAESTAQIYQIGLFAAQFGVFPSGGATQAYPDASGVPHTFSVAQFVAFLRAIAPLVSNLSTQAAMMGQGGTPVWPAQTAVVA